MRNTRKGWITKNIRTRVKRMVSSLEDRGVTHAQIAAAIGYKNVTSVSLMKNGHCGFSREKYDALRDLYRAAYPTRAYSTSQPARENGSADENGDAGHENGDATPTATYVAEALGDLEAARVLFQSAERRIQLAAVRAEDMARKIREVGLN